jgi:hypothetical protein
MWAESLSRPDSFPVIPFSPTMIEMQLSGSTLRASYERGLAVGVILIS